MTPDVLELPVAYADARAADLELHLGLPPQEALATRTLHGAGWTVELRILGASHQVLVQRDERLVCSETVACHVADAAHRHCPLPQRLGSATTEFQFRSDVERLAPPEFRYRVDALLLDQAGDPHALAARFPGDELAATGVRVTLPTGGDDDGVSWRTWHTYPRTGEVVTTSSRHGGKGPTAGRT